MNANSPHVKQNKTETPCLLKQWDAIGMPLLLGLLVGLAAPGIGFWWLSWIAWSLPLVRLLNFVNEKREKHTVTLYGLFKEGFWLGVGYFGLYFSWFWGLHPLTWLGFDPFSSLLITALAWGLITGYSAFFLGLLWLLLFVCLRALFPRLLQRTPQLHPLCPHHWLNVFLFPFLWFMVFQLYQQTDFGIPWAFIEYTQAELPWFRSLAYGLEQTLQQSHFGLFNLDALDSGALLGAFIAFYNALCAACLYQFNRQTTLSIQATLSMSQTSRQSALILLLAVSLPVGLTVAPSFHPNPSNTSEPNTFHQPSPPSKETIALRQGNLSIGVIRDPSLASAASESAYLAPLRQQHFPQSTWVVFPEEGAVPGVVSEKAPEANPSIHQLCTLSRAHGWSILTGLVSVAQDALGLTKSYNSLTLITTSKKHCQVTFYHKQNLVPFGEYTPYLPEALLTQTLQQFGVDYSNGFSPGNRPVIFEANGKRVGALICFELIYPKFFRAYQHNQADWVVNVSNLGWFHGNPLLEAQFLAIGQLHATQYHLPLVIATNTGTSAFIDNTGRILKRSRSLTQQWLTTAE